jgi:hypothetical protein
VASRIRVLAFGVFAYEYGGRLLTSRHRVAEFNWKLPDRAVPLLSEDLALEGIALALRSASKDPLLWKAIPVSDAAGSSILRTNLVNSNRSMVILTNSTGEQLYANIELDVQKRVIDVIVSRPK